MSRSRSDSNQAAGREAQCTPKGYGGYAWGCFFDSGLVNRGNFKHFGARGPSAFRGMGLCARCYRTALFQGSTLADRGIAAINQPFP